MDKRTWAMRTSAVLALALGTGLGSTAPTLAAAMPPGETDPYLWLEQVDSPRAMDWVRNENSRTESILGKDPRFEALAAQALAVAQSGDRIPMPAFLGGGIYNFWQDAGHVRGLWRSTTLAGYSSREPHWRTVLDLDRLATDEKANWVWHGADCVPPREQRCLVSLSEGGEDAVTVREFDLQARHFVPGGFELPRGKQGAAWEDGASLLVSREWDPGELTAAGYPYVVKRLRRGQALAQAQEVYRGKATDMGVWPLALDDGEGARVLLLQRALSFFESETWLVTPGGTVQLALPAKLTINGLVSGSLVLTALQEWSPAAGTHIAQGSLVAIDLAALRADPRHPHPVSVYEPGAREAVEEVSAARGALFVHRLDNVRGRISVFRRDGRGWSSRDITLPDNAATDLVDVDRRSGRAFVSVSSFLQPSTLLLAEALAARAQPLKQLPAQFDATRSVVEQHEATSNDGTRVPYFVVRPRTLHAGGDNPTILHAYGGFQSSSTPFYSGAIGKLWLERGGTFVLANIRGGGEFGPAWHEAGLKTKRQVIYDDFAAVARDLIARGITNARHLGIQGGSNGGLLMGVEFNQHPELWRAVDIQVPLLDMLRFEQIAAGASWVAEYGSVSVPEEREFLARISPYQNLRRGVDYPMPLIWTTTKDDRVGPQHARKFAARLAEYGLPYLYYEVIEGGHGAGANLQERANTTALEMTYFTRQLMD
jgi:prolyl oligopeptidase